MAVNANVILLILSPFFSFPSLQNLLSPSFLLETTVTISHWSELMRVGKVQKGNKTDMITAGRISFHYKH